MRQIIADILKNTIALDVIKTVITLLLGAAIPIFSTWLNNRHTRQMQIEQWKHEDEKAKIESEKREKEKLAEQELQQRTQIVEIYSKAIAYLVALSKSGMGGVVQADIEKLYELQPYLLQIQLSYPNKDSNSYKLLSGNLERLDASSTSLYEIARGLRLTVLQLAREDSRLFS